jgi:hypothetical protein
LHTGIEGNEIAERLAKQVAADASELKVKYEKTTKSTIATGLKKEGIAKWQRLWERTNKGAVCRLFLLSVEQRLQANLPISPAFTAIVSGHGKTKSYLHRLGIIDSQTCPCKGGDQTPEHLIHHCNILETQRDVMIHTIQMSRGTWPTSNKELIAKYQGAFTTFINSLDFNKLT